MSAPSVERVHLIVLRLLYNSLNDVCGTKNQSAGRLCCQTVKTTLDEDSNKYDGLRNLMRIYSGPDYRPDIDGLRAIAVVLVVLHHAGVGFTKGGFIGVDVFFVISGFLITRILLREIEGGTFSLLNFYQRRSRRIFPALFAMFAVTSVASSFLLFPNELSYFGTSLLSATFFVANILFFHGQGYFAGTSDIIPLLHTWSLSVEEQFYLVFPLLLLWVTKRKRLSVTSMTFALTIVSFA